MERSWGKASQKLLLCVTVEAGTVGDYGSYYRRRIRSGFRSHPAQPDYKRQPSGGKPLRRVSPAERVTAVMPSAVSLRPALAAGTKARIRPYLFSSDNRNGSVKQDAARGAGFPGFG
ncbi:hypothetical protein [Bacteroides xylanisolvens]|uniref:hypothetical protein n=1 Tax=Bacteroides xylanisolvens TaxID=371601 RepID=UPI001CE3FDF8|nr:hypothetical protein [Bacteroides xylanisolvens]